MFWNSKIDINKSNDYDVYWFHREIKPPAHVQTLHETLCVSFSLHVHWWFYFPMKPTNIVIIAILYTHSNTCTTKETKNSQICV